MGDTLGLADQTIPNAGFVFDNTYARELAGFYALGEVAKAPAPRMIRLNQGLAHELGLDVAMLQSVTGAEILSGNAVPDGASVLAQAYAGHQFGHFVPQLGDGRALLLGEVLDRNGRRRDIQFKGSGRTVFSRGGDGKAALGPVLREYIMGEAMHALAVPTTRALAAVATGERVYRERALPGAVLTRVAASHVRVGTFQFFAARGETEKVRQLADYTIRRHYPQATSCVELLEAVIDAQASLIAKWMHVGFIHGVMNTDNMAVSGETIDYGPCAFMDGYSAGTVFSSIDHMGRYAYGRQPEIALWNLTRLAESLLPILTEEAAVAALKSYWARYERYWLQGMRAKMGLETHEEGDGELARGLLKAIEGRDYTSTFRNLAQDLDLGAWTEQWLRRLAREGATPADRAEAMSRVNPVYVPRNHRVEEALRSAEADEMGPFASLCDVISAPYTAREEWAEYAGPAADGNPGYRTFCGT